MKIIRKLAYWTGCTFFHGERHNEWQCPNKKCGMPISEDYSNCPYCGQKVKFAYPVKAKVIEIRINGG